MVRKLGNSEEKGCVNYSIFEEYITTARFVSLGALFYYSFPVTYTALYINLLFLFFIFTVKAVWRKS